MAFGGELSVSGTTSRAIAGASDRTAAFCAVVVVTAALVVTLDAGHAVEFDDPVLRATLETCIALAALVGAVRLRTRLRMTLELRSLLLFAGVATLGIVDLISYAAPATTGLGSLSSLVVAPVVATMLAGACFVAGASTPPGRALNPERAWDRIGLSAAVAAAVLTELISERFGWLLVSNGGRRNSALAQMVEHPAALLVAGMGALLMAFAAVMFAKQTRSDESADTAYLAGAALLFAAVALAWLLAPSISPSLVSTALGARLVAFCLLMFGALRQSVVRRRDELLAVAEQERHRLARDLHDGLIQDLAFIAAYGAQIADDAGGEHPLAVAARRALAASRGVLAELSAPDAANTRRALRSVADELACRFGIAIAVYAQPIELPAADREAIVRIAREGIVNAAKHGGARNVTVRFFEDDGLLVLRVMDDGRGIAPPSERRDRFGMMSMRERAVQLGGQLEVHSRSEGGTELEVSVPRPSRQGLSSSPAENASARHWHSIDSRSIAITPLRRH